MIRYTLYLTQPDGSRRVHAAGDGPGVDLDTPALPDALLTALGALYGDRWVLTEAWGCGWLVDVGTEAVRVTMAYIDYGPAPAEPDPSQVGLFG